MILEKKHNILDLLLSFPTLCNLIDTLLSDTGNLQEPLHIRLDDLQRIRTELLHDLLSKLRSHTLDQAGAKILLNTKNCGRHGLFPALRQELSAVFGIHLPIAINQKHGSNIGIHEVTNDRNQVIIVLYGALKDRVPCFWALIGNALHNATYLDHLSLTCLYSKYDGILSL